MLSHSAATRSAKLSCLSLDGESLERGQSPSESSPCQVCQQIDFPPRSLGPSEQKETIFHLLFAQRAWSKNLQSGLEDAKCQPWSPRKLLDVAQNSNAAPVAADEGSSVMGLTSLI